MKCIKQHVRDDYSIIRTLKSAFLNYKMAIEFVYALMDMVLLQFVCSRMRSNLKVTAFQEITQKFA